MARKTIHVSFLCTGNSARSILAEAILRRLGAGRFTASSAGSHPTGRVHPLALEVLAEHGYETAGLRSKSWDELSAPDAPPIDLIVTVCDRAAGESCPVWPGHPLTAHWGIDDPAACRGSESAQRAAFRRAFHVLERRIGLLTEPSFDPLDPPALARRLEAIARETPALPTDATEETAP